MDKVILGIDPGKTTGAAIVEWHFSKPMLLRYELLHWNIGGDYGEIKLLDIPDIFLYPVDMAVIEVPTDTYMVSARVKPVIQSGIIAGIIYKYLQQSYPQIDIRIVSSNYWRHIVCMKNKGLTPSDRVINQVFFNLFPGIKTNQHIRDAALIAWSGGLYTYNT